MTTLLSRQINLAGHNHETTSDHYCSFWWKPTSPTTTVVRPGTSQVARYLKVGPSISGGWAKVYAALDWRWVPPAIPFTGAAFMLNWHNTSWDNGNTGSGGIGWGFPAGGGVSSVAIDVRPSVSNMRAHVEYNGPTWEPNITLPAPNTWQSLMVEITCGLKSTDYTLDNQIGSGLSHTTVSALTGGTNPVGRLRVWQDGVLTLDSVDTFSGGIRTLQVGKNPANSTWYMQGWYDFWQGIYYSAPGVDFVTYDGVYEMTACRVGQTADECLGDTTITANTSFDAPTTYDSTQGAASANGHSGNTWATTPAVGQRTIEQFVIPPEFRTLTPPVNSVAPAITGTATLGQTLTCSTGTWSQTPTSYVRQWQRSYNPTMAATMVNIGSDQATYVVTAADVGMTIRCVVTASNSSGAGSPTASNTTAIIHDGTGNYVANSTFETDILYWALNNGGETLTRDTSEHNTGAASLKVVTSAGTFKGVFTPVDASGNGVGIAVNVGDRHRITAWIKGAGNIRFASKICDANDVTLATPNVVQAGTSGSFSKFEIIDDAVGCPTGSAYRQLSITTGSQSQNLTVYVDDVSVIAYVPPPPPPPPGGNRNQAGTRAAIARPIGGTHRADEGGWF